MLLRSQITIFGHELLSGVGLVRYYDFAPAMLKQDGGAKMAFGNSNKDFCTYRQ